MLVPHGTMILVVDGGSLRLLCNRGTDFSPRLELVEQKTAHNPPSRAYAGERPGRVFESACAARHAHASPDYHARDEDDFGVAAYERIERSGDAPAIIIAPPHMLGVIRTHYSRDFSRRLIAEIDKDLTHHTPGELGHALQDHRD